MEKNTLEELEYYDFNIIELIEEIKKSFVDFCPLKLRAIYLIGSRLKKKKIKIN
jgi:hypothetical protein